MHVLSVGTAEVVIVLLLLNLYILPSRLFPATWHKVLFLKLKRLVELHGIKENLVWVGSFDIDLLISFKSCLDIFMFFAACMHLEISPSPSLLIDLIVLVIPVIIILV